jgi:hypothetical protein
MEAVAPLAEAAAEAAVLGDERAMAGAVGAAAGLSLGVPVTVAAIAGVTVATGLGLGFSFGFSWLSRNRAVSSRLLMVVNSALRMVIFCSMPSSWSRAAARSFLTPADLSLTSCNP